MIHWFLLLPAWGQVLMFVLTILVCMSLIRITIQMIIAIIALILGLLTALFHK